ncbi:metalloreductase STEAP4-like [Biomphalaria glabrata]|uniref:Metalloreductase STEAP4-like n=1 Tax=Biomphalaria glabrata TaxID=6526 RepID=A0A9W2YYM7_BIOGL|nr:metalloreductase STEAP4-like [Biomphalaria glabrata]
MDFVNKSKTVTIIGMGDFGRALAKRLLSFGYSVTFGCLNPNSHKISPLDPLFSQTLITSTKSAIRANEVVFLCISVVHFQHFAEKYKAALSRKIVVDVSNRVKDFYVKNSNAEFLQSLLPDAIVVKAFNVVSAYVMEGNSVQNSRVVPVASNHSLARQAIIDLGNEAGFRPYDAGMLSNSGSIELNSTRMFAKWKVPVVTAAAVYALWWLFVAYVDFIRKVNFTWEQVFLRVANKPLCMTAITLLALTYLPGCLAAMYHLVNDTKYHKFPKWLDSWLAARRQIGLVAFALTSMHVYISTLLLRPTYFPSWFNCSVIAPGLDGSDTWMNWKGELSCLTGLLGMLAMCVLAVITIPGVTDSLNWAEWRFLQSKCGCLALLFSTGHAWVMGAPVWMNYTRWVDVLTSETFVSSFLPALVVVLRVIQSLPFIRHSLIRIRKGRIDDDPYLITITTETSQVARKTSVEMSNLTYTDQTTSLSEKLQQHPNRTQAQAVGSEDIQGPSPSSGDHSRVICTKDSRAQPKDILVCENASAAKSPMSQTVVKRTDDDVRVRVTNLGDREVTSPLITSGNESDSCEELVSRV